MANNIRSLIRSLPHQAHLALRMFRHGSGQRAIRAYSTPGGVRSLESGVSAREEQASSVVNDETYAQPYHENYEAADNPDPLRRRFNIGHHLKGWALKYRNWKKFIRYLIRPPLTPEQAEAREEMQELRRFKAIMGREAFQMGSAIINLLADLGFCQKIEARGKKTRIKKMRFDKIGVTQDGRQFTFHIDPFSRPYSVHYFDIVKNQRVMDEIMATVGHIAHGQMDTTGASITVERAGKLGMPEFVEIKSMWEDMPDNLPPLAFPVGIAENNRPVFKDLDDCPHLLVAGATGQGKSNLINVILCTYLRRLKPNQVRFVLFDLKQGAEFAFYERLPHLMQIDGGTGIVENIEQAIPVMQKLLEVMNHRLLVIKEAGYKNMNDYNMHKYGDNRLPALVVAIDEWARIALRYGDLADRIMGDLGNIGRAAGVYIILGSQFPSSKILEGEIKVNFGVRAAFNMSTGASNSVIGSWDAHGLPCKGRMIFQDPVSGDNQLQSPRIPDSVIRSIVHHAITGKSLAAFSKVDPEEVLAWSMDHNQGRLDVEILFSEFRHRGLSKHRLIEMLKNMDGKPYDIKGTAYIVVPRLGRQPRRMELAEKITPIDTD